jgi:predicted AAA+ superfamily ATPase
MSDLLGIYSMRIKRYLELQLPENQYCFLWGVRKTGESTYLKECFSSSLYIDLLQADEYQVYSRNLERLLEEVKTQSNLSIIIINEVQKVPLYQVII